MCRICVLKGLEDFMEVVKDSIKSTGSVKMHLPTISFCSDETFYDPRQHSRRQMLQFPGKNFNQARQCVVMLRVIKLIIENMQQNSIITTRDIYYQDVELFGNQAKVSAAIERLCINTGVKRSAMGIIASPKGLIVADLVVTSRIQEQISVKTLSHRNGPSVIPNDQEILNLEYLDPTNIPKYVLIVEKEGCFSHIHAALTDAIIITGKGFPDHCTRKFLHAIHCNFPDLPIYGLVDSDVHGIHILHTYENSGINTLEHHYPIETIKFLGASILDYTHGWVDINTREYKMIMGMLQKDWISDEKHAAWRREVQLQMFMGKKVEMNILDRSHTNFLVKYIREKVQMFREREELERKLELERAENDKEKPQTMAALQLSDGLIDPDIREARPRRSSRLAPALPLPAKRKPRKNYMSRKRRRRELLNLPSDPPVVVIPSDPPIDMDQHDSILGDARRSARISGGLLSAY